MSKAIFSLPLRRPEVFLYLAVPFSLSDVSLPATILRVAPLYASGSLGRLPCLREKLTRDI